MLNNILIDFRTTKVSGCTVLCEDGYVSFINSRQAGNRQAEAYRHELTHEAEDDFRKDKVQDIEMYAHEEV